MKQIGEISVGVSVGVSDTVLVIVGVIVGGWGVSVDGIIGVRLAVNVYVGDG